MEKKIRVGINGYGNIGKACEYIITNYYPDMELKAIFSRRNIAAKSNAQVISSSKIMEWEDELDVLIMCNGSKDDLPLEGSLMASIFNTVDSYDNHSRMTEYYNKMNQAAKDGDNLAIIGAGWDPGKFSKERIEASAYYPDGYITSFWGIGVSQGHTNAIKEFNKTFRKNWIIDAIQYTHPIEEAMDLAKKGQAENLTARDKHWRECFIAITPKANEKEIENWIKHMPDYFEPYKTIVHFVSLEEINQRKEAMFHAGKVIGHGLSEGGENQISEYSLDIASNPEHTARILVAHARANYKLRKEGQIGALPAAFISVDKLHYESIDVLIKKFI